MFMTLQFWRPWKALLVNCLKALLELATRPFGPAPLIRGRPSLPDPHHVPWLSVYTREETRGRFRKRVVFWRMYLRSGGICERTLVLIFVPGEHLNVPSFRFSFRGNIRQNHPFWKSPFCESLIHQVSSNEFSIGLSWNVVAKSDPLALSRKDRNPVADENSNKKSMDQAWLVDRLGFRSYGTRILQKSVSSGIGSGPVWGVLKRELPNTGDKRSLRVGWVLI